MVLDEMRVSRQLADREPPQGDASDGIHYLVDYCIHLSIHYVNTLPQLSTSSLWYFSLIKIVARRYPMAMPMACERRASRTMVAGATSRTAMQTQEMGPIVKELVRLTHRFANTSWVSSRSHDLSLSRYWYR